MADTEAPPAEGVSRSVLKRHSLELFVKLTTAEKVERGQQLAAELGELNDIVSRHESQKRQMKAEVSAAESKIASLRTVVSNGQELRTVDVEDQADYARGRWQRVRMDTGAVVHERQLTEDEAQVAMPGV